MRRMAIGLSTLGLMATLSVLSVHAGQAPPPKASNGWVKLPAAGATSTDAYVAVENPGMYDIYLLSASSDVAGSIEIRRTGKDAALEEVTVPANGSLDMDAKGVHLLLKDLKKPLNENDKVSLTLVTELGVKVQVDAVVKKE
jgi:copper(I)-binding protein